jgi:hypothetical protein
MDCPEFQQCLQDRFDGATAWDRTEFHQHLAQCPECRELHLAARRFEDGLRALAPVMPPPGLAGQIVAQVLHERRAALRLRRRLFAGAALAASLLLAFIAYTNWPFNGPVSPSSEQPAPVVQAPTPTQPDPALPSLREGVAEAGSAGVAVAKRVTDETVQPIRMFWPDPVPTPGLPGAEALQQAVDPAAQGVRELRQGVSVVGEPMANGFRRWGDMVFRHLSTADEDPKEGF